MAGRLGTNAMGAVGLGDAIFFCTTIVGMGTLMGLRPLIAQALGAKDELRARELMWQGLWLSTFVSAALTLPLLAAPSLVARFGIDPAVVSEARGVLLMRMIGLPAALGIVVALAYLEAQGWVAHLVLATLAANVLNLLGDLLFVYGGSSLPVWIGPLHNLPPMGAKGVGLSTTLCTVAQFVIVAWPAFRLGKPGAVRWRPCGSDLRKACRVGVPVGLQLGAAVGIFALAGILAGRLGTAVLAAHQVALGLASFTSSAAVGIASAGGVRVAKGIGARDSEATRRSGLTTFACGAAVMAGVGTLIICFRVSLGGLITTDPNVIAVVVPLLGVVAVYQVSDGVQAVGVDLLRAAGDTRYAFLATVLGHYGVGLPLALILGFTLKGGVVGIWWGLCAGLTAVAVAVLARFAIISARRIKPLEQVLFGKLLQSLGLATGQQVEEALALQKRSGRRLGDAMVYLGYITEEQLRGALCEAVGLNLGEAPPIGELLVKFKHFTPRQLAEALERQKIDRRKLGEILVEQGFCTYPEVSEMLSLRWWWTTSRGRYG